MLWFSLGLGFLIVFMSLSVHEFFHAVTAFLLGDDTARKRGRLSLNPLKHIDRFGTVILPGSLFLLSALLQTTLPVIGYAKPVPVNPSKLKIPRISMVLVAMAGPFANIFLSVLSILLLMYIKPKSEWIQMLLLISFKINIFLAAFNALPIPPLDGSRLVQFFLPARWASVWERLGVAGFLIILFFLDGKWVSQWSFIVEKFVLGKLGVVLN